MISGEHENRSARLGGGARVSARSEEEKDGSGRARAWLGLGFALIPLNFGEKRIRESLESLSLKIIYIVSNRVWVYKR